jgi:CHAT domain-containing protein/tetratricopeptide (TPR) repeat protein
MVPEGFEQKLIRSIFFHRTLFQVQSGWSHLSLSIWLAVIVLMSVCFFAAYWTGCQTVSLDEAKDISLQFSGSSFEPPPRSIKDVVSEHCENFNVIGCLQKPTFSLEEIYEQHKGAPPYPHRYSKAKEFQRMAWSELNKGRYSRSIQLLERALKELPPEVKGARGNRYATIAQYYAYAGDLKSANRALGRARYWYDQTTWAGPWKSYIINSTEALIQQIKGNLDRAERYFRLAIPSSKEFSSGTQLDIRVDLIENLIFQGRLLEAEALTREMLQEHRVNISFVRQARGRLVLSKILFKQGRYREAEYVAKCAILKYNQAWTDCSSIYLNLSRQMLAKSLMAQGRWQDAIEQFEAISAGLKNDPDLVKVQFAGDVDWAIALLAIGKIDEALQHLKTGLQLTSRQVGKNHYRTAIIRGSIAAAHAADGDKEAALAGFAEAVPLVVKQFRKANTATHTRSTKNPHLIFIIESYMNLLADIQATPFKTKMGIDALETSFTLADFVRAHAVQRAVSASSARYGIKDPELADLVRSEQDSGKRLDALYGTLAVAVTQPTTAENSAAIESLKEKIDKLSRARFAFIKEIESRFPKYAQWINPVPPSFKEVKASLRPGESLLSIYIGRNRSFVWAVPYEGKVRFATVSLSKSEVDTMVAQIRSTLEPNAKKLGEIPQFDLETAYALFKAFFEPVRQAWKNAKSLLVVPHGALSYLPLSLLPTEKIKLPADKDVWFGNFKHVPWLVHSHAVTVLPSVSTLILLRAMPQGDRAQLPFVGFGDPYFNEQQARAAAKPEKEFQTAPFKQPGDYVLRGLSIKRVQTDQLTSAQIELLPRLPETAEEIRSMALAMNADPNRDVFTGAQANEQQVKTMDLSRYKVLAFATHGLAPGDLDGLLQPALALSSPKVAGIGGDGFLTMEEIFGLWLNTDWVVLSACNTAAGREQGAEALSGLCRAFFYAGAQALLITNWRVETNSAKALTTDLFRRQAQNPLLTRADALRQSKLFLIDAAGRIDPKSGKVLFSYAHPIFWAAFSLVGG